MSNQEILKELGDKNCLNCKWIKMFKSQQKGHCQNPDSPLVNKVTHANLSCDKYEKKV